MGPSEALRPAQLFTDGYMQMPSPHVFFNGTNCNGPPRAQEIKTGSIMATLHLLSTLYNRPIFADCLTGSFTSRVQLLRRSPSTGSLITYSGADGVAEAFETSEHACQIL
ncbi:hypothetical protein AcW1_000222 [Taiwanofungus camphoratus]|nr:hypothetical protein AcV5_004120 [Antrodia cinnamomea]KAI0963016.1 hypothetical protein AcW1_000222 [Antrodia cinnamomea]